VIACRLVVLKFVGDLPVLLITLQILRFYFLFCGTDDAALSKINRLIPVLINWLIFAEYFCEFLCAI